jgi:hypothetical protein
MFQRYSFQLFRKFGPVVIRATPTDEIRMTQSHHGLNL